MKQALEWLLELLYPPKCVLCQRLLPRGGQQICESCFESLPNFEGAKPAVSFSDGLSVCFFYEGMLRQSFLRFKFSGRDFYAKVYGKWMAGRLREELGTAFDCVSWVPVSRKRRRRRGYDQAELLAGVVARELSLPLVRTLQKHAERAPQSRLHDAQARRENARNAFSAYPGAHLAGTEILLIDDIVTTGATLSECCRVLKGAGAKRVVCGLFASPRNETEEG